MSSVDYPLWASQVTCHRVPAQQRGGRRLFNWCLQNENLPLELSTVDDKQPWEVEYVFWFGERNCSWKMDVMKSRRRLRGKIIKTSWCPADLMNFHIFKMSEHICATVNFFWSFTKSKSRKRTITWEWKSGQPEGKAWGKKGENTVSVLRMRLFYKTSVSVVPEKCIKTESYLGCNALIS